jgi:hypothetical protein
MTRLFALILTATVLTGCSELKVISGAAMRELRADGYNVEQISYNYHQKLAAQGAKTGVMMAKANAARITTDGYTVGTEKKLRLMPKAKKVRGLWESEAAKLDGK